MTSRAQQRDTEADRALYTCIHASPPQSFLMISGAGSGKTTSLVKGLNEIVRKHGHQLSLRRQKVACITYTEVAAREIWEDVGSNPLVHVSTIHSFLWTLIRSFQSDIRAWVSKHLEEKIAELREAASKFGPRVQQRTRDKNQNDIIYCQQQMMRLAQVRSFTYGTGSDYVNGLLGHDDIIKMVTQIVSERPLMRTLLAQQYPFLLVDESQDTFEVVVEALKAVHQEHGTRFCLGFFGDPMQRIYITGIGAITANPGWASITKPENFRCPATVLSVANAIRRDGDGLVQTRGRRIGPENADMSVAGSATCFILPIDERRDQQISKVRGWAAERINDPAWQSADANKGPRILVVVHRMAAKRLGFGDLYAALNDKAPEKFKSGFLDGTAWPVRPFINFVMPLVTASKERKEFDAIEVLRRQSPLLARENLSGIDVAQRLAELRRLVESLGNMMEPGSTATVADVLRFIHEAGVITLDPRVKSYLNLPTEAELKVNESADGAHEEDEEDGEELTKEVSAMDAFLACPAKQFWGYSRYVNDDSPFSTQQGIKGAEFERVLVVLDDDEGSHMQFSYDKYLGIKPLSDRDDANRREGKETAVERTRRLFYVCCTRALKDLIVVLFTGDVAIARRKIEGLGIFPPDAIYLEAEIAPY